jgi:SAM-dependent methyltransferase
VLPFADGTFDSIIASSVFEYLVDVPRVAAELARVLRPGGYLLLTVPNPGNRLRKLEAWAQSTLLRHPLPPLLRRVQKFDSYTTYLRLSRNRFGGSQWDSLLRAAGFSAIEPNDFAEAAWRKKSKSPLIMLTVQRTTSAAPLAEADLRQQLAG